MAAGDGGGGSSYLRSAYHGRSCTSGEGWGRVGEAGAGQEAAGQFYFLSFSQISIRVEVLLSLRLSKTLSVAFCQNVPLLGLVSSPGRRCHHHRSTRSSHHRGRTSWACRGSEFEYTPRCMGAYTHGCPRRYPGRSRLPLQPPQRPGPLRRLPRTCPCLSSCCGGSPIYWRVNLQLLFCVNYHVHENRNGWTWCSVL